MDGVIPAHSAASSTDADAGAALAETIAQLEAVEELLRAHEAAAAVYLGSGHHQHQDLESLQALQHELLDLIQMQTDALAASAQTSDDAKQMHGQESPLSPLTTAAAQDASGFAVGSLCCVESSALVSDGVNDDDDNEQRESATHCLVLAAVAQVSESTATVLVLTPTTAAMQPCANLSECEGNCDRSHGHIVAISSLSAPHRLDLAQTLAHRQRTPTQDDSSDTKNESESFKPMRVLARFAGDGLFYPAVAVNVQKDGIDIEFDGYSGETHLTAMENVVALVSSSSNSNSVGAVGDHDENPITLDSDSEYDDDDDDRSADDEQDNTFDSKIGRLKRSRDSDDESSSTIDNSDDDSSVMHYNRAEMDAAMQRQRETAISRFGSWEAHTKGIGAKLLAKMGYRPGEGLGKEGEGMVNPVPIIMMTPGRGLGHAEEAKRRRRRHKKQQAQQADQESGGQYGTGSTPKRHENMFSFMNATLNAVQTSDGETGPGEEFKLRKSLRPVAPRSGVGQGATSHIGPDKDGKQMRNATETTVAADGGKSSRIRSLQIQEEAHKVQVDLKRAQDGLARNRNDPRLREIYESKIAQFQVRLSVLNREGNRQRSVIDRDKLRKSMTKF